MGHHRLHAGLRRSAFARGTHCRHRRAQACLCPGSRRVRDRLGRGWVSTVLRSPAGGAGIAGWLRRAARPDRTLAAGGDLHRAARTGHGIRGLWLDRRQRRRHRPPVGRGADAVPELALVPVRERPDRGGGRHWRMASFARRRQDVSPALRCPGCRSRHRRPCRAGLCLFRGRVNRMGIAGSDHAACREFGAADPVRGSGNAHIRASPSAADRARP